ncbi:helicase HerA-like domain-containing protein [uncultured Jannaschia sp.]|uniref:helicase HerA-like domain-containing protein n=1 Tax=uncultured Jannaschia sp. TaxID=293347 RepID=UPI00341A200B
MRADRKGRAGGAADPVRGRRRLCVTQNPEDIPGQLGSRVQHRLRAITAKDRRVSAQVVQNYRANPDFGIAETIREVGKGETVTSSLERKSIPGMAERTLIRPLASRLGPIMLAERAAIVAASPVAGRYDTAVDSESATRSSRSAQRSRPASRLRATSGPKSSFGAIRGRCAAGPRGGHRRGDVRQVLRQVPRHAGRQDYHARGSRRLFRGW